MASAHQFEGRLTWRTGGDGVTAGNHPAHDDCCIANSVACPVRVEATIVTGS
jgi:hypothetical protein